MDSNLKRGEPEALSPERPQKRRKKSTTTGATRQTRSDDTVRRQSHNIAEKKRRDKINHKINELKQLVPLDETKKSSNKSAILSRTVEFIRRMESHYQALWDQNQQLVADNRHFKQIRLSLQQAQMIPTTPEDEKLNLFTNIPPPQVPSPQPKQEGRNPQDNRLVNSPSVLGQFYPIPPQNMTSYFQIPPTVQSGQVPPPTSSPLAGHMQSSVAFYPPLTAPWSPTGVNPLHAPVIMNPPESLISGLAVMSSAMVPPVQVPKRSTPPTMSGMPMGSMNDPSSPPPESLQNSNNNSQHQRPSTVISMPPQNSQTTSSHSMHIPTPLAMMPAIQTEGQPTTSITPPNAIQSSTPSETSMLPSTTSEPVPTTPPTTSSPNTEAVSSKETSSITAQPVPLTTFMSNSVLTSSAPVPLAMQIPSTTPWSAPTIIAVQSVEGVKPVAIDSDIPSDKPT